MVAPPRSDFGGGKIVVFWFRTCPCVVICAYAQKRFGWVALRPETDPLYLPVREGGWMAQHMLLHVEDIRPVSTPILHINTPHAETGFWLVSTHTICWLT